MEMNTLRDMVLGKPAPLVSTFRLSYYSILNLMSRAEGQFTAEHVIKNSFHQFQYEKALPDMGQKISKLEEEAAMLDASGEVEVAEYHKLKLDIAQLEKKMMAEITRPVRLLYFLLPGRLVKVREAGTGWGWGVVINVVKKPPAAIGTLPPALSSSCGISYIVDTLLHCSIGSSENGSHPKPCPPRPGEKGEMHVVPVQLPLISALSKIRISIPSDLRPVEARQSILLAIQELEKRFPQGLPKLNPVKLGMAIKSDLSLLRSVPAPLVVDFFHFIGFGADMGNFVPIDELGPYVNSNELVDVIGVVQNVSPTMSIRRKINNETIPKRDITIADETKKTVVVSLWNDLATNIEQELLDISDKSPVVAIKALKVGDFQGVSLSALSKSIVVVNPDTPESKKLRSWYDSEGKEVSMASIGSGMSSTTNTGTRSMYIDRKPIQ